MPQLSSKTDLRSQWIAFRNVVLDPWVLVLGLSAVLSGNAALGASPKTAAALLTLVASVVSGILGGRITHRWSSVVEESVIVARGKSAVRGLKLLLGGVADLEKRTRVFLGRCGATASGDKLTFPTASAFEEVVGRCRLLEEQVLSSIENWTDIVPEADIKTQIGEISRLADEVDSQFAEVRNLEQRLAETQHQSASEKMKLQDDLEKKEKLLRETQRKLASQASLTGLAIGSPLHIAGTGSVITGLLSPSRPCSRCGKNYTDDYPAIIGGSLCPNCRSHSTVTIAG